MIGTYERINNLDVALNADAAQLTALIGRFQHNDVMAMELNKELDQVHRRIDEVNMIKHATDLVLAGKKIALTPMALLDTADAVALRNIQERALARSTGETKETLKRCPAIACEVEKPRIKVPAHKCSRATDLLVVSVFTTNKAK